MNEIQLDHKMKHHLVDLYVDAVMSAAQGGHRRGKGSVLEKFCIYKNLQTFNKDNRGRLSSAGVEAGARR